MKNSFAIAMSLVGRDRWARRLMAIFRAARRSAPPLVLALFILGCARSPSVCAVCNRDECKGMAFRMTLENGKTVETCCPRCGLHYLETNHVKARQMEATDFATGNWVDATHAVFVSDSNVHPCATLETRRDPQGCCMTKTYDRCLPSLVAFESKDQAAAFQKDHGGQLVAFQEIQAK